MIYFDNAATGGFKPHSVVDSALSVIRYLCANPGRSGHRLSIVGTDLISRTRETLAQTFFADPDRVIFTKNCTEALNLAIFGSLKKGGHVITTTFEHNSVLRPLFNLKSEGLIELDIVAPEKNLSIVDAIKEKIKDNTYLIAITAVSNVTGETFPIIEISKLCKAQNILLLVDGAQGGGHVPLKVNQMGISMLALAGHKGLYGIMGSGALILDNSVSLKPLIYGGTGTETFNLNQPTTYPERLEAGTLNLPAISALGEGTKFVLENMKNFADHLLSQTKQLISGIKQIKNLTCYSKPNPAGIVSFSLDNLSSGEVADILSSDYDVAVRGGFHCAPLTHKFLKTDSEGLVRASLAVQNSSRELSYFINAVKEIANR